MAAPWLNDRLAALKPKALDAFSKSAITGAQHALMDIANPLRLNFFSTAMRILFEHMMGALAPVDQVVQSEWFTSEREDNLPTRGQRIAFAVQGGLGDAFVKDTLQIDIAPIRKKLIKAVDNLSKHVHGREETIIEGQDEQDAAAASGIDALEQFLDAYHECRTTILTAIQDELDDAAVNALITDTILEVDELATHHSVEEVYVGDTLVLSIGPHFITYRATGTVAVTLQWGSNSDLRRGDGAEADLSFPFRCDIEVSLDDPLNIAFGETEYAVDVIVARWHGAGRRRSLTQ
jgi:predicted pPIWI-associating nuclease